MIPGKWMGLTGVAFFIAAMIVSTPLPSLAKEAVQEWELLNPEGVVQVEPMALAPRITTLEGKTVVLRWNGKPNGNILLDRVAELLSEKVKDVKVVKSYEIFPEMSVISHTVAKGQEFAKKLLGLKPDIVIGAIAD